MSHTFNKVKVKEFPIWVIENVPDDELAIPYIKHTRNLVRELVLYNIGHGVATILDSLKVLLLITNV